MKISIVRDNLHYGALAIILLVYGIWRMLSIDFYDFGNSQRFQYYLHYGEGYVHRGLIGSLVRFFVGVVDERWLHNFIPRIEIVLNIFNMIFLWGLLMPRILTAFLPSAQLPLIAFAGLLLLSPMWGELVIRDGYFDEHIHIFALFGMVALLTRRPLLVAVCGLIAILIHRQGIFYAGLLAMFALHLILYNKQYRDHWRRWLAVAIFFPTVFIILQLLNDNEAALKILRDSNVDKIIKELDFLQKSNFSVGGYKVSQIYSMMAIKPEFILQSILIYGAPPLLAALFLPYMAMKLNLSFIGASPMVRYLGMALPSAATVMGLPMLFLTHGNSRNWHLMWIFLALVLVYYVWFLLPVAKKNKKQRVRGAHVFAKMSAIGFFTVMWVYGGSPILMASYERTWIFPCRQFCMPGITSHFGNDIVRRLWEWQVGGIFPMSINAGDYEDLFGFPYRDLREQDGAISIPAEYPNTVFSHILTIPVPSNIHVVVRHHAAMSHPLRFSIREGGGEQKPTYTDNNKTEWILPFNGSGLLTADFKAAPDVGEFKLVSVHIEQRAIQN